MCSIARIGDRSAPILAHRIGVEKRTPIPGSYTGLQFLAALGEGSSRACSDVRNRLVAQQQISGIQMLRLQHPVRCYEEHPFGPARRYKGRALGLVRLFQVEGD
jgi:hypothetical protein